MSSPYLICPDCEEPLSLEGEMVVKKFGLCEVYVCKHCVRPGFGNSVYVAVDLPRTVDEQGLSTTGGL